jgi:hypothetical protein
MNFSSLASACNLPNSSLPATIFSIHICGNRCKPCFTVSITCYRDTNHSGVCSILKDSSRSKLLLTRQSMKLRTLAVVLFSAFLCLAQANNQSSSNNSTTQAQPNAGFAASCCKAMSENKDAKSCCHHDSAAKDAKESCCSGMDKAGNEPMSCMKEKAKSADSSARGCCRGTDQDQKRCCAKSEKASEQSAMSCCAGSTEHCRMPHHEHDDMGK